ncbi:hypothetical protein BDY19DRAFT_765822 [Irpex rosettiformis]|uniref:Uncharacterized protein n=1 Tax=Irpex rosettiformis TaxID=378272 RepID=A0ACB8U7M3_9APHY|nr:hypothetical protein BDY19DRAFT_765822 [Irpex rosettiformis]
MHSCLLVSEIFELIAHFSNEDGLTPSTVASLSRTCRSFHEIAEDVLWRRLNGLTALMHCFGHGVCGHSAGPYYFTKYPEGHDWQKFNRRARRVQSLALGQSFDAEAELQALQVLDLCRPDPKVAILPNLRELRWCDLRETSLRYVSLFVHPGLVNFNALVIGNPRVLSETIAFLSVAAPGLRSLRISPGAPEHEHPGIVGALGRMLTSSPCLAELSVRAPVCAATLPLLAHHPRLEVLSVRVASSLDSSVFRATADIPTFRSLRRLTALAESVDDVVPLLNMVESPNFSSLVVHLKIQPTTTSLHHLFRVISRHRSFQSLNILVTPSNKHRSLVTPLQTSQQYVLTPSSFRYLLGLSKLTHLIITQIPTLSDDQLVNNMASAWPCLERLSLGTAARLENPGLSLESIRGLVCACPRLGELGLAFNPSHKLEKKLAVTSSIRGNGYQQTSSAADRFGRIHRRPASALPPSRLQVFDIGCSSVGDVKKFAQFVVAVFPDARICDAHGPTSRLGPMRVIQGEVTKARSVPRWA